MTTAYGDDIPTAADLAAEALLGALLWDPRRVRGVADWLETDDFLRPAHGAIYATLVGMLADGRPIDPFTVLESLQRGDHHDLQVARTGGGPLAGPGLHSLISMTPATPRAEDYGGQESSEHVRYARIVLEDSIRRQVEAVGIRIGQYAKHVSGRESDEAADILAPVLAEVAERLHELTGRLGDAGTWRSSIAAALDPAPRPSPTPAPGTPSEHPSGLGRPAVDAEQLRDAEDQLIGACLVSTEVRRLVEGRIRGSDFQAPEIAATWEAITALRRRGDPVDFVLVAAQVEQQGALPGVGQGLPPDQLHKLATRSDLATGYWSMETIVRAALARNLQHANDQLQNLAADRTRSGADVLRGAEHVIEQTTTTTRRLTATARSPSGPAAPAPAESDIQAQRAAREGTGTAPTGVRALTDPERALLADRLSREPGRLAPSRTLAALHDLGLTATDSQGRWYVTTLGRQVAAEQRIARRPSQAATTAAAALTPPAAAIQGSTVRRLTGTAPAGTALAALTPPEAKVPAARQPLQPDAPAPPRTAGRPPPPTHRPRGR